MAMTKRKEKRRKVKWVHVPYRRSWILLSICINYTRKTWHCGNKLIKLLDSHTYGQRCNQTNWQTGGLRHGAGLDQPPMQYRHMIYIYHILLHWIKTKMDMKLNEKIHCIVFKSHYSSDVFNIIIIFLCSLTCARWIGVKIVKIVCLAALDLVVQHLLRDDLLMDTH